MKKDWLEKSFDRKPDSIEVIIQTGYISLFPSIKEVAFLEGRLLYSNLFSLSEPFKNFQIALIGWKKAGHPKSYCFWTCK